MTADVGLSISLMGQSDDNACLASDPKPYISLLTQHCKWKWRLQPPVSHVCWEFVFVVFVSQIWMCFLKHQFFYSLSFFPTSLIQGEIEIIECTCTDHSTLKIMGSHNKSQLYIFERLHLFVLLQRQTQRENRHDTFSFNQGNSLKIQ